ncbi:MAG: methyl-accepting chemotaxis protein [Endomicrobiaceae bacterium]|nr:methyl-accepting chemotaxis protein [Endomicrobiaceae bacterium]
MIKKRRQYLVKPKLQLKYLTILGFVILISSVLIYYVFLDTLLSSPGMDQLSAGAVKHFVNSYTSGFFWAVLIFMAVILIESIFYFHRLIGPIFFFEKVMKHLSEGNFIPKVHFRKKDETKELAIVMDQALSNIKNAVSNDRKKIEEIKLAITDGNIDKARQLLCELTQWFKIEDDQK